MELQLQLYDPRLKSSQVDVDEKHASYTVWKQKLGLFKDEVWWKNVEFLFNTEC